MGGAKGGINSINSAAPGYLAGQMARSWQSWAWQGAGIAAIGGVMGGLNSRRSAVSGAIQPFTSMVSGGFQGGLTGMALGAGTAAYSGLRAGVSGFGLAGSMASKAGRWGLFGAMAGVSFGALRGYYRAGFTSNRPVNQI